MLTDKEFIKLQDSIDWSMRQLDYPRQKYHEAIELAHGKHYALGGSDMVQPVSLLKLTELIYVRLLAPHAPRAMFSTMNRELKATAYTFELAFNQIIEQIGFDDTLAMAVIEALYSPQAVLKVGLHTVSEVMGEKYGRPFADLITFDDYFRDMSAKRRDQMQYEGNDYWMNFSDFMDSDWIEKKAKMNAKPDEYTLVSDEGNESAQKMTAESTPTTFKDKVLLRDVWLPEERTMLTYRVTSKKMCCQMEADDNAPEHGPYHSLQFMPVPGGNNLAMPPVALWRDLHEVMNMLYRKLAEGAMAQKRVQGFNGGDPEEIKAYRDAKDGDGISYTGQPPQPLEAGGINQSTLGFFIHTKDLGSWMAGNLDSLGGLSPMADTVGQERLMSEAAGAMIRGMGASVIEFVREVYRSLAKYEWYDPMSDRVVEKEVPETDIKIPVRWNKQARKGDFDEYSISIDIYDLQDNTPSVRLHKLRAFVSEFVIPLQPFVQQQGGMINAKKIIDEAVRCMGVSEYHDIVQFTDEPLQQQGEKGGPGKPANTTRTYDRVSRPGASQRGKDQILQQALFGGEPQDSEKASVTRSVG